MLLTIFWLLVAVRNAVGQGKTEASSRSAPSVEVLQTASVSWAWPAEMMGGARKSGLRHIFFICVDPDLHGDNNS